MIKQIRAGILGAGLGSRLNSNAGAKPLATLAGGKSLLENLLWELKKNGVTEISCALRSEQFDERKKASLPAHPGLQYLFKDTESSLHTLAALVETMAPEKGPALFMMADTIMLPEDFSRFLRFCRELPENENAVLVTGFVDDEKPLWVNLNQDQTVARFGGDHGQFVTSGMYFLSPAAMLMALEEVQKGTHKMRNFLCKLLERELLIKSFVVSKTIDVDHPSDLENAARFLRADEGPSS